ncbi:hypothetical protein DFH09DRAFT_1282101 [Mycena vulgaris]|nr:hypothetical protein DFH09DRAFT_1282101 [Mycena vulgaris]
MPSDDAGKDPESTESTDDGGNGPKGAKPTGEYSLSGGFSADVWPQLDNFTGAGVTPTGNVAGEKGPEGASNTCENAKASGSDERSGGDNTAIKKGSVAGGDKTDDGEGDKGTKCKAPDGLSRQPGPRRGTRPQGSHACCYVFLCYFRVPFSFPASRAPSCPPSCSLSSPPVCRCTEGGACTSLIARQRLWAAWRKRRGGGPAMPRVPSSSPWQPLRTACIARSMRGVDGIRGAGYDNGEAYPLREAVGGTEPGARNRCKPRGGWRVRVRSSEVELWSSEHESSEVEADGARVLRGVRVRVGLDEAWASSGVDEA